VYLLFYNLFLSPITSPLSRTENSHSHLSLVSSLPRSTYLTSVHRSHLRPPISPISLTTDTISTSKPQCTRPRNDAVVELSGTWCVGLAEATVTRYWSVGIDQVDGGLCIHWCDAIMNVSDSDRFVLFDRWWWLVAGCGWFWVCVGSVAQRRRQRLAGYGWFWVYVGSVARQRRRWLGVGDFGFVLGLWESSREEREGNNKKCKNNEYFIK